MYYVYTAGSPGNPWGPFETKAEAHSWRAYMYENFKGVFSVRKG